MRKAVETILAAATAFAAIASTADAQPAEPFVLSPPPGDGPVVVKASFQVRDINDIDDAAETFQFTGVLTLTWRDERSAFDPDAVGVDEKFYQGMYQFSELSPAWYPQVVLVNESGLFESHGVLLRVQPDGTSTLIQILNAAAEADLDLHRYPFDRHRLDAVFEVLGADNTEVVLEAAPLPSGLRHNEALIPQWRLERVDTSTRDRQKVFAAREGTATALVVSMEVERQSFFVVRLIVFPLALIVMLSWSVFWMERSSLADRISISFIGVLTAVAYQIVVSEIQPDISYMTLMHGFLNLSFIMMCATVPINLWVGALDRRGRTKAGARVDHLCRWVFPSIYFGLTLVMLVAAFTLY